MPLFSLAHLPFSPLLAATPAARESVSALYLVLLVGMSLLSYSVEYVYAQYGDSADVNWRNIATAAVLGIVHIAWRTWAGQSNLAMLASDPSNVAFRWELRILLAVSIVIPVWLVANSLRFTWLDRFVFRGLPLSLTRLGLGLVLALCFGWQATDLVRLLRDVPIGF